MSKKVVGYDANALYPSTMLGDMPCGKEVVVHWPQTPGNIEKFCSFLQKDKWFDFTEVDIEVPRELWEKFQEMPPLFFSKTAPSEGSATANERLLGPNHQIVTPPNTTK